MKQLLHAIEDYLKNRVSITGLSADSVYVAIDAALVPISVQLPCVGIKDGSIEYAYEENGVVYVTSEVALVMHVEVPVDDESIKGTHWLMADGILSLADDVRQALTDNLLDIAGMETALPTGETETELVGDEYQAVRKILTMRYTRISEL